LIEAAGCKSMRCGAIRVSGLHANFFVNDGGGTSADFLALVDRVRERILEHCGVELALECRMWGF
jgi:UDP-N-acetylmuramate dehydrogenase